MLVDKLPQASVGPLFVGAVTALSGAHEALLALTRRPLPQDPIARRVLRKRVDDGLAAVEAVAEVLSALRRRLED
jgi:hypothetical protein